MRGHAVPLRGYDVRVNHTGAVRELQIRQHHRLRSRVVHAPHCPEAVESRTALDSHLGRVTLRVREKLRLLLPQSRNQQFTCEQQPPVTHLCE